MFRKFKLRKIANNINHTMRCKSLLVAFPYKDYPSDLSPEEVEALGALVDEDTTFVPLTIRDNAGVLVLSLVVSTNVVEAWNAVYHLAEFFELSEQDPEVAQRLREQFIANEGVQLEEHPEPLPDVRSLIALMREAV